MADVMGVSLTGFCANINKNSNDLTNKHGYNFDSQFLIIQIPNYILYPVATNVIKSIFNSLM